MLDLDLGGFSGAEVVGWLGSMGHNGITTGLGFQPNRGMKGNEAMGAYGKPGF